MGGYYWDKEEAGLFCRRDVYILMMVGWIKLRGVT